MFSSSQASAPVALSRLWTALPRVGLETLVHLDSLRRQRSALKDLDAHLLRDIGVSPEDAEAESRRRAWDLPKGWKL